MGCDLVRGTVKFCLMTARDVHEQCEQWKPSRAFLHLGLCCRQPHSCWKVITGSVFRLP